MFGGLRDVSVLKWGKIKFSLYEGERRNKMW